MRTSRKSKKKLILIKNKNMADVKEDWFVNLHLTPRDSQYYDPQKETAYLIEGSSGTYDLYTTFAVTVKRTLEAAQKFVIEHEEWRNHIEELAVKDDSDTGDYAYQKLLDEYNEYICSLLFPGKKLDDPLTDEEELSYDDYYANDENFVEWMTIVKNFSEEKARATIEYNSDEKSEFHTDYSIYRINIED